MPYQVQQLRNRIDFIAQFFVSRKTTLVSLVLLTALYSFFRKINKPPKNLRHFPTLTLFQFYKNALRNELFETYSKKAVVPLLEHNGIYVRPSVTGWALSVANPSALKQLLLRQENVYPKAPTVLVKGSLIDRFVGGPNIFFTSGSEWKRHKQIANPAFQRSMPVKLFGDLAIKSFRAIEREGLSEVDVLALFEKLTLDAIGIAGFGMDFNALGEHTSKWVRYYDTIKEGLMKPFFLILPMLDSTYLSWFKERQKVHKMLDEFIENIDDIIDQKKTTTVVKEKKTDGVQDEEKDLLTLMIESAMKGEGNGLTNEELRSDLLIFFISGHDTTANALGFALYELARKPELQEKAREEAIRILGAAPEDIVPTYEQTKQLSYITMIMKETLRLYPPVSQTSYYRVIHEDMDLAGSFVPKGTEWAVDIYNLHHDPSIWKDPYRFDPDRFLPGGEADQQEGIAWAPFNYGQRQCIGMNFSLAEQRVVLAMLLRKYRWTLPEDSPHKDKAKTRGIIVGLLIVTEKLKLSFEKLY